MLQLRMIKINVAMDFLIHLFPNVYLLVYFDLGFINVSPFFLKYYNTNTNL